MVLCASDWILVFSTIDVHKPLVLLPPLSYVQLVLLVVIESVGSGNCKGSSLALQGRGEGGGGGPREPTGKGCLHGDGYRHHHAKT